MQKRILFLVLSDSPINSPFLVSLAKIQILTIHYKVHVSMYNLLKNIGSLRYYIPLRALREIYFVLIVLPS